MRNDVCSFEASRIEDYIASAEEEQPLIEWWRRRRQKISLFVAEGFEERGLGVLRALAKAGIRVAEVVLGHYSEGATDNSRYVGEFARLAEVVGQSVTRYGGVADGSWISLGAERMQGDLVVLDISALSNDALFCGLDELTKTSRETALAYSEAGSYWPTRAAWRWFKRTVSFANEAEVGSEFDLQPYLYGGDHHVILVPGHEGYDTPGAKLALLAFLPFKAARLAALLSWADYSKYILVVGTPRLKKNYWRRQVALEINARQVNERRVIEVPTFGYLECLGAMMTTLEDGRLLERYDVHMAPMGSKLQNVAAWVLSAHIPSMSVVLSIPSQYYPQAFSEHVGRSWAFALPTIGRYGGALTRAGSRTEGGLLG